MQARSRLFGETWSRRARTRIGFLPEERGLFAHERARDVIAFQGRLKGMAQREAYSAADRLLERAGLGERQNDRIGSLSKGNAQRVQVLSALVHHPRLLVLDEPLAGLDPVAQAGMLSLFAEFRTEGGAILFSTHRMAAAEDFCDRVVMLANGRTVFEGALSEVSGAGAEGAIVSTADVAGLRETLAEIGGQMRPLPSAAGEAARWRIVLPLDVTNSALSLALARHGVALNSLQPVKPDLETTFWNLAAAPPFQPAALQREAA